MRSAQVQMSSQVIECVASASSEEDSSKAGFRHLLSHPRAILKMVIFNVVYTINVNVSFHEVYQGLIAWNRLPEGQQWRSPAVKGQKTGLPSFEIRGCVEQPPLV